MSTLLKADMVTKALGNAPHKGKHMLEPVASFAKENKFPYGILEDHEVLDNLAEVHKTEGDLWICYEGNSVFVCGGEMVEPWAKENTDGTKDENELKAKSIKGGERIVLEPGDVLWIPPGEPHQHNCEGTTRLAIIKIPKR